LNILQTSRLTLRELVSDDLDYLSLVLSDPEVMRYSTIGVHTDIQLKEYIQRCTEQYKTKGYGRWGIFTTIDGQFIGLCGLTLEDDELVHINYRLATKFQGKGYATETVSGLLEYAQKRLNIGTLSALIESENVNSIKVVLRKGFELVNRSTFRGVDVNVYQIKI
jgi:ribosomal-protein-alanine N-acetyltransferase